MAVFALINSGDTYGNGQIILKDTKSDGLSCLMACYPITGIFLHLISFFFN